MEKLGTVGAALGSEMDWVIMAGAAQGCGCLGMGRKRAQFRGGRGVPILGLYILGFPVLQWLVLKGISQVTMLFSINRMKVARG